MLSLSSAALAAALALATLQRPMPPPAPAAASVDESARFDDSMAPRQLGDFAGTWSHHGFWLTVQPNGGAEVGWRDYSLDTIEAPVMAHVTFTRAQDRTAYGVVSDTRDAKVLPIGEVRLLEYGYGIGALVSASGVFAPKSDPPMTLCGPRYVDPPDWLARTYPCGS